MDDPVLPSLSGWNPLRFTQYLDAPLHISATERAWHEHVPFAMFLVEVVAPRVLVELGTHSGTSYCSFCQAIQGLKLSTRSYAVDTWQGDSHASQYGTEILAELRAYHDPRYGEFSELLQATFDEALHQFEDGSIDLLHIDGFHAYEQVKHDFETWLPKMSRRGIILFHDTEVRERGFGVFRLWEEIETRYPSFGFLHGYGLGMIAVGDTYPKGLGVFFSATTEEKDRLRTFFHTLGRGASASAVLQVTTADLTAKLATAERISHARAVQLAAITGEYEKVMLSTTLRRGRQIEAIYMRIVPPNSLRDRFFSLAMRVLHNCRRKLRGNFFIRAAKRFIQRVGNATLRGLKATRRVPGAILKVPAHLAGLVREVGAREALRRVAGKCAYLIRRFCKPIRSFEALPWVCEGKPATRNSNDFRILVVSHEATRTGAPLILLALVKELVRRGDCTVHVVLNRAGELVEDFARVAPTLIVDNLYTHGIRNNEAPEVIAALFQKFAQRGLAICNTVAVGPFYEPFANHRVPVLAWIHELPSTIDNFFGGRDVVKQIERAAKTIVTPVEFVRNSLIERYGLDSANLRAVPYGVASPVNLESRAEARVRVRRELNLPPSARIVLGCGGVSHRKGTDLFAQVARQVFVAGMSDVWFVWVGPVYEFTLSAWLAHDANTEVAWNHLLFVGGQSDISSYLLAADLFLLTSREDPFPLANLDALASGLPVIAFKGAGGAAEVLDGAGAVVPYLDVAAMSQAALGLLADPVALQRASQRALQVAQDNFTWERFADAMVDVLRHDFGYYPPAELSVTVIVPNYNHAPFLDERLRSLFAQTRPPQEIIVLDDASTDDSVQIVRRLTAESPVPMRVVVNNQNSGSTFRQWLKGIELASGDLIWIAESDDSCRPEFLERIVPEFYNPDVVLAYTQSVPIGPKGQVLGNYLDHTWDISPERWRSRYTATGKEEVAQALLQKNTIPNASAVVLRRSAAPLDMADELTQFKFAGDWFFYAMVLRGGKIAFVPEVLNKHRKHDGTVTSRFVKADQYAEETLRVKAQLADMFPVSTDAIARTLGMSVWERCFLGQMSGRETPSFSAQSELADSLARLLRQYEANACPVDEDSLRILMIANDMEAGDGQMALVRLANHLAKKHRVLLLNARPSRVDSCMLKLIDPSVRFLEGTLGTTPWSGAGPEHRIHVLRELVRIHEVDVISSHVWWADKLAYDINRELGLPWFIHLHSDYAELSMHPEREPEFLQFVGSVTSAASGVFYGANQNLHVFDTGLAAMPRNLTRSFNGCDPATIRRQGDSTVARLAEVVLFVLVAPPMPEKGWEEAIQATLHVNALPGQERGGRVAKLLLIGQGPHADELRDRYGHEPAIEFRGQAVPALDVVVQCDIGLFPSRLLSESAPLAVIDYLACGLPVIATNVGALPEMIRYADLEAGTIVTVQPDGSLDVEPLARAMLAYVKDDDLRRRHQADARAVFDAQFHIDRIATVCEEAYRKELVMSPRKNRIPGTQSARKTA